MANVYVVASFVIALSVSLVWRCCVAPCVRYTPAANWNGADVITVMVRDGGGGGSGGSKTTIASVDVAVTAVNDAPVIAMPTRAFHANSTGSVAVAGVSVADADLAETPNAVVEVTVRAVGGGVVSVAHSRTHPVPAFPVEVGVTAAALFSAGGVGLAAAAPELVFVATLKEANDLLSQLTYHGPFSPPATAAGGDATAFHSDSPAPTVTLSVSDLGASGDSAGDVGVAEASAEVTLARVNRPPVVTAPASVTAIEDVALHVEGLAVADPDSATHAVQAVVAAATGFVMVKPASGVQISASAGRVAADDGGLDRYTSVTLRGAVADINAALQGVFYLSAANFNSPALGGDTVTVTVDDEGHTGAGGTAAAHVVSAGVEVWVSAVNDAPTVGVPDHTAASPLELEEDSEAVIRGITVDDVDLGETVDGVLEVKLSASHGVLAVATDAGLHVAADSAPTHTTHPSPGSLARPLAPSWTLRGSVAALRRALGYVRYRADADYFGTDVVSVWVSDLGATGSGGEASAAAEVALRVVPATDTPVLAVSYSASAPLAAAEDTAATLADVQVEAPEAEALAVSIECGHCALAFPAAVVATLSDVNADAGHRLSFRGSVAAVRAGLPTLMYTGAPDWNSDIGGLDAVTYTVELLAFGVDPVRSTGTAYVHVAAVDDPPSVAVPEEGFRGDEDLPVSLAAVLVSDPDVDDVGGSLVLSLAVQHGVLRFASGLGGLDVAASIPDARLHDNLPRTEFQSVSLRGSLASLQAALRGLAFVGGLDWSGDDELVVSVEDPVRGPLPGGAASAAITIAPVNDAPVVTAPGDAFDVAEDSALALPFTPRTA